METKAEKSLSRVKKSEFYGLASDFNVLFDFYWLSVLLASFKARENCRKTKGISFKERHNSKNKALFWDQTMTMTWKKVFVNNLAIAPFTFRATVKGKELKIMTKKVCAHGCRFVLFFHSAPSFRQDRKRKRIKYWPEKHNKKLCWNFFIIIFCCSNINFLCATQQRWQSE